MKLIIKVSSDCEGKNEDEAGRHDKDRCGRRAIWDSGHLPRGFLFALQVGLRTRGPRNGEWKSNRLYRNRARNADANPRFWPDSPHPNDTSR
jgi:hypothetical protein